MTAKISPDVADGDEVIVVFTPVHAKRQTVVGTLGASIDSRGGIDAIIVSGDGWAVHIDPVTVLLVLPADTDFLTV